MIRPGFITADAAVPNIGDFHQPPWMTIAKTYAGLREVPGTLTAPAIAGMLRKLRAWWDDDETPWCGTLVAACMQDSGLELPQHWYRAMSWVEYGRDARRMPAPGASAEVPYGAVVIRARKGGGHVHFYIGSVRGNPGMYWGYGGNQDNQVCARAYKWDGVVAVRWPRDYPVVNYKGPDAIMAGDMIRAGSDA